LACLEKALPLHQNKKWFLMEDHIRFQYGMELARRQLWAAALHQFSALMHATTMDSGFHGFYLEKFVHAFMVRFPPA
jgi:hypothetical protein